MVFCLWSKKRVSASSGFTLVEVLIAVVILAFGLVLVVEAMGRTQHALRISQNLVIASQLAEEKLTETEMEVRQYHQLHFGSDEDIYELPGKKFKWSRTVNLFADATIEEVGKLNEVAIRIDWREGANRLNQLHLESLMVNREKEQ